MKKSALILLLLLCLVLAVSCTKTEKSQLNDITTLESTNLPKALAEAQAFVEKYPTNTDGWFAYGRIALASGEDSEAYKAGTEWIKLDPSNIEAARFTAQAALALKDADALFTLLIPYQEKGQLTVDDEIILAQGYFINRDFAQVHTSIDALLSNDLTPDQKLICYETNFNAYLLESDFSNALVTASAAVENLSLDYNNIVFRMAYHLAIDPTQPETFHVYSQILQSYSKEDKAKFVQLCLVDLNLLDRLGFNKDYLPRVLELLSEHYAYIGGEPSSTFESIGNAYHSYHIGQMDEQVFIVDPKTSETVLHYPQNKEAIHLSEEFGALTMSNILINGWQFVTSQNETIHLTGFTKTGNVISTPVVPLSVYANYRDGNNLIVIDDKKQLQRVDLQTKEVTNLNFNMSDTQVIGIRDHQLLLFSYIENALLKINLETGLSAILSSDPSLANSDIVDYDGTFIYCVNAWPSESITKSNGQWLVHAELMLIDPDSGAVEKMADILTADLNLGANPTAMAIEKADRIDAMMLGGDYLYLNTTNNLVYRFNKTSAQLEFIGNDLALYGVVDASAYFKDSNSDDISTLQHGAAPSALHLIKME